MTTMNDTHESALPPADTSRSSRLSMWARRHLPPWLLLAPGLLTLAVLLIFPLFRVVDLSLQDYGLRNLLKGTTNY
ncbi:MAG: sugar ABC transporter permease, partial [Dermabacter sp.]|nr:sugar ABC transporter permease [Dermabacter sp.]